MKEVIQNNPQHTILVDNLPGSGFYGVVDPGGLKGFITILSNRYAAVMAGYVECFTLFPSLKQRAFHSQLIREALKQNYKIYHFETYKELYKWLSE